MTCLCHQLLTMPLHCLLRLVRRKRHASMPALQVFLLQPRRKQLEQLNGQTCSQKLLRAMRKWHAWLVVSFHLGRARLLRWV